MKIGIVGSEAAKFTPLTEKRARIAIQNILHSNNCSQVISGGCHLGGIDIWAIEEAKKAKIDTREFLPVVRSWSGYRTRNLLIAKESDKVVCITVRKLPKEYNGMRFPLCYHCGTADHVKSGGCWTMKQAKKLGKKVELIVI